MAIARDQTSNYQSDYQGPFTLTWSIAPQVGATVLVFASVNTSGSASSISVTDNGSTPSTFVQDIELLDSNGPAYLLIYRANNISLPSSGNYTVTISGSSVGYFAAWGRSYTGVKAGAPTAKQTGQSLSGTSSVATGSVTAAGAGALYFACFYDFSTVGTETITMTQSGFTTGLIYTNTAAIAFGTADKIDAGGPTATQCTWTLGDAPPWDAGIAVYEASPTNFPFTSMWLTFP